MFCGLNIVPVYGIAILADVFILNVIDFWTGSSPFVMNEGELERQTIAYNGCTYEVEATINQFAITPLEGDNPFKT